MKRLLRGRAPAMLYFVTAGAMPGAGVVGAAAVG